MPASKLLDRLDRYAARPIVRASILAVALSGVYLQAHTFFLSESHEVDSYSYWFAAQAIAHHANPYDLAALQAAGREQDLRLVKRDPSPPEIYPYVYPPPFAGLWRVFLPLPPARVHRVLEVLGTLALGAALLWMERAAAVRRHGALMFAAFAVTLLVNGPAVSSTRLGQVNAPLLALMAFAVASVRGGKATRSAMALAGATLVKLTPVLLWFGFGGLSEPRGRRYGGALAASIAVLVLVSLPLAPPVHWAQFWSSLRDGLPWRTEFSLWGWLSIHAEPSRRLAIWRVPIYAACATLAIACAWRHQLRLPPSDRALEGAASAVVLGLLLSPLTWQHHFLFFMLPAWAWLGRAWSEERTVLALAFAGLTVLVLLRLPGSVLAVRPLAAAIAFALATLGPCATERAPRTA
jgi:hypothetical protein